MHWMPFPTNSFKKDKKKYPGLCATVNTANFHEKLSQCKHTVKFTAIFLQFLSEFPRRVQEAMSRLTEGYLAATAVTACNSCDSWEDWQYCCCWWLTATDSVYKTNVWASSANNCWDVSKLCPTWLRHVDTSHTALSSFNYRYRQTTSVSYSTISTAITVTWTAIF